MPNVNTPNFLIQAAQAQQAALQSQQLQQMAIQAQQFYIQPGSLVYGDDVAVQPAQPEGDPPVPEDILYDEVDVEPLIIKKAKPVQKVPTSINSLVREVFPCRVPTSAPAKLIHEFLNSSVYRSKQPYEFCDMKSKIGIEIEVENVKHIDPAVVQYFWDAKTDGSLRNYGREFITKGTIQLMHVEPALMQLYSSINRDVDFSIRTGIHIHQDVRGMTLNQVVSLVLLYLVTENLLFKFAGTNRRNSIYCVPLNESELMPSFINSGRDTYFWLTNIQSYWHKYSALNLLPLRSQGSVEYRQFPGTNSLKQIMIWIDLLAALKLSAYKKSTDGWIEQICDLNTSSQYNAFIQEVFGSLYIHLDSSQLLRDMEQAVYLIKNCIQRNDFHAKVASSQTAQSSMYAKLYKVETLEDLIPDDKLRSEFNYFNKNEFGGHNPIKLYKDILKRPKHYMGLTPKIDSLVERLLAGTYKVSVKKITQEYV